MTRGAKTNNNEEYGVTEVERWCDSFVESLSDMIYMSSISATVHGVDSDVTVFTVQQAIEVCLNAGTGLSIE